MRHSAWIRGLVVASVGLVVVAYGFRPAAKAGQPIGPLASTTVLGAFGGGPKAEVEGPKVVHVAPPPMSPAATRVWAKLQEKISMNFPSDTPLEDVKKYIEQSTQDEKAGIPVGIPIYVDPQGLQDADKTMASTIVINLEGMPLHLTLDLILKQLNLGYFVNNEGLLIVTHREESDVSANPTLQILKEMEALKAEIRLLRDEIRTAKVPEVSEKPQAPARPFGK